MIVFVKPLVRHRMNSIHFIRCIDVKLCVFFFLLSNRIMEHESSSKEKHSKAKNADKGKSSTKETSLRERAVAKLKILNFNINWDVHMKPCGYDLILHNTEYDFN